MLTRADLNGARPAGTKESATQVNSPSSATAASGAPSATDPRQEVQQRLNQIAVGQQVRAAVVALLKDGSQLVDINGAQARMLLPAGTKVGDNLSLLFMGRAPRPTFMLLGAEGSVTTSLSNTARLIDQVLQATRNNGNASGVAGNAPLLPEGADLDTARLASALKDAFGLSGMFYESHLEEWVAGRRSQQELGREPQASLPRESSSASAPRTAADAAAGPGSTSAAQHSAALDADLLLQGQQALPALDPETARLVSMQLDTLEQRRLQWQGELFPGQPMEWEVAEEREQSQDNQRNGQQDGPTAWTSTVRFRLPTLGEVSASVRLVGDSVQVQIGAPDEAVAATLRAQRPALALALDAAGAPLEAFSVKKAENN